MKKVLTRGITVASILYALVGLFGYLTFVNNDNELVADEKAGLIIMANYNNRLEVSLT